MPSVEKSQKKQAYFDKVGQLAESYPRVLVVLADHVGSKQMSEIRRSLRGKAILVMGKNTMMRTALKQSLSKTPQLDKLIPLVKLNVGFVFCLDDPTLVRSIIMENRVPAAARQGVIAPRDVSIPAGPTGMDPSQTSFFQALGISTKIAKGQIEIQSDVHVIKTGDKVTASQSVLLQKLDIRPFTYGLQVMDVYDDGSVYSSSILDITDEDTISKLTAAVRNVAALSRELGIPTQASVPHCLVESFKHCAALCLDSDFKFKELEKMLSAPSAGVAAAPVAAKAAAAPAKKEAPAPEPEEEDDDMGMSLFD